MFVSCGDDADIDFDGGVAADAFDGAFAEGAEELSDFGPSNEIVATRMVDGVKNRRQENFLLLA